MKKEESMIAEYIKVIADQEVSVEIVEGIAPMNGPKNGIIFVTPTMTAISSE